MATPASQGHDRLVVHAITADLPRCEGSPGVQDCKLGARAQADGGLGDLFALLACLGLHLSVFRDLSLRCHHHRARGQPHTFPWRRRPLSHPVLRITWGFHGLSLHGDDWRRGLV